MQKQMGAPDDAERFCVFGDSHRLVPADGWWRSRLFRARIFGSTPGAGRSVATRVGNPLFIDETMTARCVCLESFPLG